MRDHEVPTHLQVEDKVLLGLTFPQLVAAAAVVGLAYGLWRYAGFLPAGVVRIVIAVFFAVVGFAVVLIQPGGRALPAVIADVLRFAVAHKRYQGTTVDLFGPKRVGRPVDVTMKRSRRWTRPLRKGLPFRCLSTLLAAAVLFASLSPQVALGASPQASRDGAQRLFIERWRIAEGQASITVRAATSLDVRVSAETVDGRERFQAHDVLFKGEAREYHVPLSPAHRAIVIAWRDALGNAGIRVLDGRTLPYPLPRLEGEDCTLAVAEIGWAPGKSTGRLTSTCRDRTSESVDAVVLTDPDDPSRTVRQRLLVDAVVREVTGSVAISAVGSTAPLSFNKGGVPFTLDLPVSAGVHGASLNADLTSTRVAELPGRVEFRQHGEKTVKHKIPVVATFDGFFTKVTGSLTATWQPVVHTVSAKLSAWFAPVTRTLSATLRATWDPYLQTVGGWVSATVGKWLSAVVGTTLWARLGTWVSATVGTWLSTTVGKWLSATVGAWVTAVVGSWLSATVGTWVSGTVGVWVSATVGKWLSATVGTWVSTMVGAEVWTSVGTWVSTTVGSWVSTNVGTWVSAWVGTWVSAWVGGFYTTVSGWVNWIIGWFTSWVWVPSQLASGYASGTASGYASGTASGYATGSASGYASGSASGYASGTASGYASGVASDYASGTATGYASGTATGYASGTASGYASTRASEYASGSATGYASGTASGYASGVAKGYAEAEASRYVSATAEGYAEGVASKYATAQVLVPGKSDERTVNETVTAPGQTKEQTVGAEVLVPGRTVSREVSRQVWVPGKEVRRDVDVEVAIPGFTSAEVVKPEPLVITYREQLSTTFPLFADAPHAPIEEPSLGDQGGGSPPSQIEQYVQLIDKRDEGGPRDGGDGGRGDPFRDALDRLAGNPYFDAHPDEAARLRSALFLAWIDGLTLPIDARLVLEGETGAVASKRRYEPGELAGAGVGAQALFRELVGKELK